MPGFTTKDLELADIHNDAVLKKATEINNNF